VGDEVEEDAFVSHNRERPVPPFLGPGSVSSFFPARLVSAQSSL